MPILEAGAVAVHRGSCLHQMSDGKEEQEP